MQAAVQRRYDEANQSGQGQGRDAMRTHLIMFNKNTQGENGKRKKRKGIFDQKYSATHTHQDAAAQTVAGIDGPIDITKWTGNQRVVHYGPMGSRDQYYYFYPKGWDTLYPAAFGFFPYRTKNFRGSSISVCLAAFGTFFALAGGAMTYLGYFVYGPNMKPNETHTLEIAGPVILGLGVLAALLGVLRWCCSLQLCNESLRHTQPHLAGTRRRANIKRRTAENSYYFEDDWPHYDRMFDDYPPPVEKQPRQQFGFARTHSQYSGASSARKHSSSRRTTPRSPRFPPPVPAVLENTHTDPSLYSPEAEMKLYPPSGPGGRSPFSTLYSGAGGQFYIGSPYNTLGSRSSLAGLFTTEPGAGGSVFENRTATLPNRSEYHAPLAASRGSLHSDRVEDPKMAFENYDRTSKYGKGFWMNNDAN